MENNTVLNNLSLFIWQGIKFCFVGVLNTLLCLFVVFILTNFLKTNYVPSIIIGNIIGVTNSFFWNKYFTFKTKKLSIFETMLFVIVFFLSTGFQIVIFKIIKLYTDADIYILKYTIKVPFLLSMIAYTAVFFIGSKFIAFNNK
ncbi:MAG: GtrA family protein [Spirochaetes bacterium]|nr:GtrA family protein [Spirochaetota bacterium]